MTDLRVCTKGVGFAAAASAATVVLTTGAFGQGSDVPSPGTTITVPGASTGTTVGFINDTTETCPYAGSTSPDVFYAYFAGATQEITLDLCQSGYDSQVYVYDSNLSLVIRNVDLLPACNDDACSSSGGGGFRSFLDCVPVQSGGLYFIAIDGWSGAAGPYDIVTSVTNPVTCAPAGPCIVECVGTPEGEPCKFGNTLPDDTFNGGCNSSDPAGSFSTIACDEVVCGQGYFDGGFRDTDWYALDVSGFGGGVNLTIDGLAEFSSVYGRVDNGNPWGSLVCGQIAAFAEFAVTPECDPISLIIPRSPLGSTVALIFVGTDFTQTVDCNDPDPAPPGIGADYALVVTCVPNAPPCPWDFNGNNEVDFPDLLKVLSNYGPCPQ